jgi:hypothetical protein
MNIVIPAQPIGLELSFYSLHSELIQYIAQAGIHSFAFLYLASKF